MNEQRATVDRRDGRLIVVSYSKTIPGFWVVNGSFEMLSGDIDPETLGIAVEAALEASSSGLVPPDRSVSPMAPILRALGLRSFGAYANGAVSVGVSRAAVTTFQPERNAGARTGFVEFEGAAFDLDLAVAPVEVGRATLRALAEAV